MAKHHDEYAARTAQMADFVVSGRAKEGLQHLLMFQGMESDEVAEFMKKNDHGVKAVNSGIVDRHFDHLDSVIALGTETLHTCPPEGMLKLRARRAGQQVVVSLCMSDLMRRSSENSGDYDEPVEVHRTRIAD